MVPIASEQPTIRVDAAASLLGISRGAAYLGVASGDIPSIRIGKRIVIPTAALRRLLQLEDECHGAADVADGGDGA